MQTAVLLSVVFVVVVDASCAKVWVIGFRLVGFK